MRSWAWTLERLTYSMRAFSRDFLYSVRSAEMTIMRVMEKVSKMANAGKKTIHFVIFCFFKLSNTHSREIEFIYSITLSKFPKILATLSKDYM